MDNNLGSNLLLIVDKTNIGYCTYAKPKCVVSVSSIYNIAKTVFNGTTILPLYSRITKIPQRIRKNIICVVVFLLFG